MSVGLLYSGMEDAKAFIALAKGAEALGIDSVWIAEQPGYRDAFVVATSVIDQTDRIKAFAGPISPYSRHPMAIAVSAATLHEIAPGRVGLIIGTGGTGKQEAYGVRVERPIQTMREAIGAIRSLLNGETLNQRGERFQFYDAKLGLESSPLSIFMAAIGPKMQRTAGAYADGVVFSSGQSPKFIRQSVERVRAAHRESPRARSPFTTVGYVIGSVADDSRQAYDNAREILSYLFSSPYKAEDWSLNEVVVDHEAILEAHMRGDDKRAKGYVSDELVRLFSASGSPSEFQDRLHGYLETGLDLLVLNPVGSDEVKPLALRLAMEVCHPRA